MVSSDKDKKIDPDEDYRCSACGILLSSDYAGEQNGECCEDCIANSVDNLD